MIRWALVAIFVKRHSFDASRSYVYSSGRNSHDHVRWQRPNQSKKRQSDFESIDRKTATIILLVHLYLQARTTWARGI